MNIYENGGLGSTIVWISFEENPHYYIELIFSSFQRLLFRFKNLELGDLGRAQILKQIE